ncbi:hypothetical protein TrLO_g2724 [Triparma laevis f. longispina]|uniref:Protein kinase domain-containing protein n=1 Tax=Triparma laevis f. longispina TaxID=1714387 RepID=A0A9W7FPP3_9STRA|nr:hypothetical protein TrLO_g2724 [Triparma laevis f. longispina]
MGSNFSSDGKPPPPPSGKQNSDKDKLNNSTPSTSNSTSHLPAPPSGFTPSLVLSSPLPTQPSISHWESAWEDDQPRVSETMHRGITPTGSFEEESSGLGKVFESMSNLIIGANNPQTNPSNTVPGSPGHTSDPSERALNRLADETLQSGRAVMWEKSVEGPSSTVNVKHFSLLRVLGKGSFGKVVLVRKKAGIEVGGLYAMKVLRKSHLVKRRQIERTKTERRVLSMVSHVFIMKLHFAFQSSEKLYLVLDYCPGGELFFHLSRYRRFPERVARFYAAELTTAIGHLHSKGIIYRDLKPENVLLDADGHVKLGDFGLAKDNICHPTQGATSMCGTPEYMAPEVLQQKGHGFSVDWWGLGMLTFEMFTGLPPWYTTDKTKLFKRLKTAQLVIPNFISSESGVFVKGLLDRDPAKRLGADGVEKVQEHSFFGSVVWKSLLERRLTPPIRPCEGLKLPESRDGSGDNPTADSPNPPANTGFSAAQMMAIPNSGKNSEIPKPEDYNFSMSPDTIENATANFDPAFTKLAVDTNDGLEGEPGSVGGSHTSQDDLFPGFSYDQQVKMNIELES